MGSAKTSGVFVTSQLGDRGEGLGRAVLVHKEKGYLTGQIRHRQITAWIPCAVCFKSGLPNLKK